MRFIFLIKKHNMMQRFENCLTETCPHCREALVRSTQGVADNDNSNEINIENTYKGVSDKLKSKNIETPEVNPEICTG